MPSIVSKLLVAIIGALALLLVVDAARGAAIFPASTDLTSNVSYPTSPKTVGDFIVTGDFATGTSLCSRGDIYERAPIPSFYQGGKAWA